MADQLKNNQPKSKKGGARPGAGRPKGVPNKATAEIREIAREYTAEAIDALADILRNGQSEAARVAAANALLDRGWGKSSQHVEHDGHVAITAIEHRIVHHRPDDKITLELAE